MPQAIQLNAKPRQTLGTGASRRLRRQGDKLPGILYGGEGAPQPIILNGNELTKAMEQEAFYSQVLSLVLDGAEHKALVRELQRHPVNEKVLHVDFLRVSADKPIQTHVPLHFTNEESCVGVRRGGGALSHNLIDVEVSCLPEQLPEFIAVDVGELQVGEAIHLSGLQLPEGVALVALTHGEDRDISVVSVQPPRGGAAAAEGLEGGAAESEEAQGS